jgi:hypothetical protein
MTGPRFISVIAPAVSSRRFSHDVPVYSFNIDKALRLVVNLDDTAITPSDSTVGTPINKGTCHIQMSSGGNMVSSEVRHFHSVGNALKVDISRSWRTPHFLCSIWDPIDTDVTTGRYLIRQYPSYIARWDIRHPRIWCAFGRSIMCMFPRGYQLRVLMLGNIGT